MLHWYGDSVGNTVDNSYHLLANPC